MVMNNLENAMNDDDDTNDSDSNDDDSNDSNGCNDDDVRSLLLVCVLSL